MATLRGGARRHTFTNADGQRHDGPDLTGSVSFLPAGCTRQLELHDVEWRWAAIALDATREGPMDAIGRVPSLAVNEEHFIFSLLQEMDRIDAMSGGLEPIYSETMAGALTLYIANRFDRLRAEDRSYALPPFKLRRIKDFVDANLGSKLSMSELATLCGLSERHFQRSFKVTTGVTPLSYVVKQRIERARLLLASTDVSIVSIGATVGFANPGHFARAFGDATGMTPSIYRKMSSAQ
ncbi:hypothetical protein AXW83_06215 [Bosea sp. PAMC 26642]|nr:hypothetical protein AXW83_06215 [Bosea sp. PAMC 26642]